MIVVEFRYEHNSATRSVIPLCYCVIGHVAVERAAHAGCACATSCASSAIHMLLRSKKYSGGGECVGECVEPQLRVLVVCTCMLLLLLLLVLFVVYCLCL